MDEELRKAAQDAARWFLINTYFKVNPEAEAIHEALTVALAKNANAAPQDQDAKDNSIVWHSVGELEQAIKDAARYEWLRDKANGRFLVLNAGTSMYFNGEDLNAQIDAAMEQQP